MAIDFFFQKKLFCIIDGTKLLTFWYIQNNLELTYKAIGTFVLAYNTKEKLFQLQK